MSSAKRPKTNGASAREPNKRGQTKDAAKPVGAKQTETEQRFSIGELATELSITTRTIRFYESKGLITPGRRGVARAYTRRDRARLLLILRGKNLGFSLEDIREYLELYDTDRTGLAQLRLLATKVDGHIAMLLKKRADLDRTLKELREIRDQVTNQLGKL